MKLCQTPSAIEVFDTAAGVPGAPVQPDGYAPAELPNLTSVITYFLQPPLSVFDARIVSLREPHVPVNEPHSPPAGIDKLVLIQYPTVKLPLALPAIFVLVHWMRKKSLALAVPET